MRQKTEIIPHSKAKTIKYLLRELKKTYIVIRMTKYYETCEARGQDGSTTCV